MENLIDYKFIGWCNEGNHDKIWTSFMVNDNLYCAWGRRGAKLSFKNHGAYSGYRYGKLQKLEYQKRDKGYKEVDEFMLFSIFPYFKEELEQQLLMKTLAGDIR